MGESRAPALVVSALLHALLLGAGLIVLPMASKPIQMAASVPITIVSAAPPQPPPATVIAPEPTPETAPAPAPEPRPTPPPPAPPPPKSAPAPVPRPSPPPKPAPAPVPKPSPPPPTPKKAEAKPLDLSALAASLPESKATPAKAARPAAKPLDLAALAASLPKGARGPARPAAGPVLRPSVPASLSGDEIAALQAKLNRLWNPNCGVEGASKVVVKVEFHLLPDGRLAGPAILRDQAMVQAQGPVAAAAAQRALTAVGRGEPYTELPRDRYAAWNDVVATFDGKTACANQ